MKALSRLNSYIWKYRWTYLAGFVFVVINNFFGALIPEIVGQAVNLADKGKPQNFLNFFSSGSVVPKGLVIAAFIVVGLAMLKAIFMFFMRQTVIVNSHRIVTDLRQNLYEHYQRLDQLFYKNNRTGDIMSRITEDINRVRMYLGPALMYFVNMVAQFVFVVYYMLKTDVVLTLYTLLPLPILSLLVYIISSIINKKSEVIQAELAGLTTFAQESFSGIRVIKAYAREAEFSNVFANKSQSYKHKSLSLARIEALFFPVLMLLVGLSTIIAIYVGGLHVEKGIIDVGTIVQFVIYVAMLTWPVISLGWVASIVQKAEASQQRINAFLEAEPQITSSSSKKVDLKGDIVFKNVSFTYKNSGIEAINDVNLTISEGEKVAIVGKTGSGKSTLADLLLRVYDPDSGVILFNNHNLTEVPLTQLRGFVGYVPQDVFLFSDTVENNIALGVSEVSEKTVKAYAKNVAVAKDIEQLPQQFKTLIGERGVMLSGGQRQRVSIARALIKQPHLLLLDEALSAVDAQTERIILSEFQKMFRDKTVVIITHRIFTLFDVDRIIVLDNGRIAEMGNHENLYKKGGLYYKLYELQKMTENN